MSLSATEVPTSDISIQWTPDSGTDNYSRVTTNDGDTSYVACPGFVTYLDMYGFSAFSLPSNAVISAVKVHPWCSRRGGGGVEYPSPALLVNGTNYLGTAYTLGDLNVYYDVGGTGWTTNPNGGSWTVDDVNGTGTKPIQGFGCSCYTQNGDAVWMTYCYIEVIYTLLRIPRYGFIVHQNPGIV